MNSKLKAFLCVVAVLGALALALYLPAIRPPKGAGFTEGPSEHGEPPAEQARAAAPSSTSGSLQPPSELKDLRLAGHAQSGKEAVAAISQLHGTGISIEDGFIGMYQGGRRQAMFWVSKSASEQDAARLFDLMDAKMPASRAFTGRTEKTVGGEKLFFVRGQGMDNYYWRQGELVVWLGLINVAAGDQGEYVLAARKVLGR